MSTRILAFATQVGADNASYFDMAARAATDCLDQAGISPDVVGALINTGVYRDSNIVEPAVSALLQKRIGIGLEYRPGAVPSFSFDLMNGACGLIEAIGVAESFFAAEPGHGVDYVLLTAGDTHPSLHDIDDFPYARTGAALLLGRSDGPDDGAGFGAVHAASDIGPQSPYGRVVLAEVGTQGRSTVTVTAPPASVELAARTVRECFDDGVDPTTALVLAPSPDPDFGRRLIEELELPSSALVSIPSSVGDPHTAAPVFALAAAAERTPLEQSDRTVIFVAAGGPVAAAVSYRHSPAPTLREA